MQPSDRTVTVSKATLSYASHILNGCKCRSSSPFTHFCTSNEFPLGSGLPKFGLRPELNYFGKQNSPHLGKLTFYCRLSPSRQGVVAAVFSSFHSHTPGSSQLWLRNTNCLCGTKEALGGSENNWVITHVHSPFRSVLASRCVMWSALCMRIIGVCVCKGGAGTVACRCTIS